jgi:phage shock protein C
MLAGVAGGVAEMLDADPSIIRVVWALLVFLSGGLALVAYIVMAIVVPERPEGVPARAAGAAGATTSGPLPEGGGWVTPDAPGVRPSSTSAAPRARHDHPDRARGGLVIGLVLIVVGGAFLLRQFFPLFDLAFWWPVAAIGLGVLLVVAAITPSRRSG